MTGVTIRVLGCGDAFGSGGRLQTCFFLESGADRLLIDCGATAMVAMRRFEIDPVTVDTIVLSHLHGDHFGGVPFFLLEAQFVSRRTGPLTIAGPAGTQERILQALEVLFPGSSKLHWRFPLAFVELAAARTDRFGGVDVLPYRVEHPSGAPAFALRIACAGRVVAYSGDTEWTEALPKVARDADLFLIECFAFEPLPKSHLDFQTLRARWQDLSARRTVLTHMSQAMLDRLDRVDVETAEDGMLIELNHAGTSRSSQPRSKASPKMPRRARSATLRRADGLPGAPRGGDRAR